MPDTTPPPDADTNTLPGADTTPQPGSHSTRRSGADAPPPGSDLYSWSGRPPQPAPRDRHWMIAVGAVVAIGLVVACGFRILYDVYGAGAPAPLTPADLKALLVPSIGSNGPIPECATGRRTYTTAQISEVPSNLLDFALAKGGFAGAATACWDFPNGDTYQVTVLGYENDDDAQSASQLISVSTLMLKPTDDRATIGDGEAFSSPGPGGTINIEFGHRHKYVFVVEAVDAGAPEVPLDDIAKQQYDRL